MVCKTDKRFSERGKEQRYTDHYPVVHCNRMSCNHHAERHDDNIPEEHCPGKSLDAEYRIAEFPCTEFINNINKKTDRVDYKSDCHRNAEHKEHSLCFSGHCYSHNCECICNAAGFVHRHHAQNG